MNTLLQDLRYGARMSARNPAVTAVALLTLALGIGMNTAIFSVLDAALNMQFPFKDQKQIANLWAVNHTNGVTRESLSIPDFLDYRQQNRVFEDLAASSGQSFHLANVAEPQQLSGSQVSFNYFHVLGVQPAIGRNFLPEESTGGAHRVAILSHELWQRSFGADRAILGRNITLNRESYTVIGVMPTGIFLLTAGSPDLWVPLELSSNPLRRGIHQVAVIGRLSPGVSKEQAQAEMSNLARRLAQTFPSTNQGWDVQVIPLQEEINKKLGLGLVFIMGPVVIVLLIACANVANLFLARASVREKEMAVRAAMGAGRLRLVRQLLTESLLLALLAGILGVLLGMWGMAILCSLFPIVASADTLHLDARVLGFALAVCLLTPLLFGLAPALYGTKLNLNESLKEGRRGFRAGGSHRFREYLVVSEVALAVALLGLGGLFVRLMLVVGNLRPLSDPKNLLTMAVSLPESAYPHDSDVAEFHRRVMETAQAIPGVESVGVMDRPPLALFAEDRRALSPVEIEGGPGSIARVSAIPLKVSPGYFSALRITPRRGRALSDQDAAGAARVALINEALARSWRGEDPLGKRLRLASLGPEQPWITVVGVVGDFTTDAHKRLLPAVYLPYAQNPERAMTFVVRTLMPPRGLEEPLKRALWSVDKDQPIESIGTLEQVVSDELAGAYAMVKMIVAFAGLALILASVGVYSVMSYVVAQCTHEIGVRMSLGARPRDVVQMLAKEAIQLIASGAVLGLVVTFVFGRLLGHELA